MEESKLSHLTQSILRAAIHPAAGLSCILLMLGLCAGLPRLVVDNRLERWLDVNSVAAREYDNFRSQFSSDEFIIISYTGKDLFSKENLEEQLALLDAVEALPGVTWTTGIPSVYRDWFGETDEEDLQEDFLATPFYKNFVIDDAGEVAGLLVELAPPNAPAASRDLAAAVGAACADFEQQGWIVHLVGPTAMGAALDELSEKEVIKTFPMALLLSIAVLWAALRSGRAVLVPLCCASLSTGATIGLAAWLGFALNMITAVLPALLWVLGATNALHLLWQFRRARAEHSVDAALTRAWNLAAWPCALSAATTAAGFFALLLSSMQPVRELGLLAGIGLLLSIGVNLTVGALAIRIFRAPAMAAPVARQDTAWERIWRPIEARPVLFATIGLLLAVLPATLLHKMRIESDPLLFLPAQSPVIAAYQFVGERLTGFYTLEAVIDAEDWQDPDFLARVDQLAEELMQLDTVARVLSPVDLLKKSRYWDEDFAPDSYALPTSKEHTARLVDGLDDAGRRELDRLLAPDAGAIRLSVLVRVMDSIRFNAVLKESASQLEARGLSARLTGIVPQLIEAQVNLAYAQLRSFALAFAIIFCCIWIGLRSWRLVLLSVLPNLLPIVAVFAIMILLDIPLDAGTSMVGSVALGIAVDDTIHLLAAYARHRRTAAVSVAIRAAWRQVAPVLVITTVCACAGFAALTVSTFIPIRLFGLLGGAAMAVAIWADLVLAPSLILAAHRLFKDKP